MAQPDDREHRQGGEEEACMAVLNDFYGDGFFFFPPILLIIITPICFFKTLYNLPLTPIWSAPSPFTNYIKIKRWIDGAQESNGTTWRATTRSQSYAKTNPGIWGKKRDHHSGKQKYSIMFSQTPVLSSFNLFFRFVLGGKWSFFGNSSSWVKIFCQISSKPAKPARIGIAFHPFYKMPPFLVPW